MHTHNHAQKAENPFCSNEWRQIIGIFDLDTFAANGAGTPLAPQPLQPPSPPANDVSLVPELCAELSVVDEAKGRELKQGGHESPASVLARANNMVSVCVCTHARVCMCVRALVCKCVQLCACVRVRACTCETNLST